MSDKEQSLVDLPDNEPDFLDIASGIEDDGDDGDSGDMALNALGEGGDDGAESAQRTRTPIRGHVSYLNVEISRGSELLFIAWNDAKPRAEDPDFQALSEGAQFSQWIDIIAARDVLADDVRHEKEYNLPAFFGTESFQKVLWKGRRDDGAEKWKKQLQEMRQSQMERMRQRHPDWSDDEILEELGFDGIEG